MKNKSMLLIFTLLSGFSLSSCNNIKAIETVKISVWSEPKEQEVIEKVIENWNEKHSEKHQIEIEFSSKPANYYNEAIIDEFPSLFYASDSCLPNLVKNDVVNSVEKKVAKDIMEENVFVSSKGFSIDDCIFGYPTILDSGYFLWYNNKFISKEEANSLETIFEIAKENKSSIYFDIANGWYVNSLFMSPQACGLESIKCFEDDNGKDSYECNWDSNEGIKVAEYANSLFNKYYMDGVIYPSTSISLSKLLKEEKIIAVIGGLWQETEFLEAIGDNLSASKLPEYHIDEKAYQMASFGFSKGYFINNKKSDSEIATANLLAQLLTSEEAQLLRYELTGNIPTRIDVIDDKKFKEIASVGDLAFAEQSKYACVQYQTTGDDYWSVGQQIGSAILENIPNNKTWAEYLKEMLAKL